MGGRMVGKWNNQKAIQCSETLPNSSCITSLSPRLLPGFSATSELWPLARLCPRVWGCADLRGLRSKACTSLFCFALAFGTLMIWGFNSDSTCSGMGLVSLPSSQTQIMLHTTAAPSPLPFQVSFLCPPTPASEALPMQNKGYKCLPQLPIFLSKGKSLQTYYRLKVCPLESHCQLHPVLFPLFLQPRRHWWCTSPNWHQPSSHPLKRSDSWPETFDSLVDLFYYFPILCPIHLDGPPAVFKGGID